MDRRHFYQLSTGLPPACVAYSSTMNPWPAPKHDAWIFRQKEDEMICIDLGRKFGGALCVSDTARAYLSDGD